MKAYQKSIPLLKISVWNIVRDLLLPCMKVWLIGLLPDFASTSCTGNQIAELGDRGIIGCSFPDTYHTVNWYGDVRDGSSPLISHTLHRPGNAEFCFGTQDYDVADNGSLIICNVTLSDEKNYTVFLYTTPVFYEEFRVSLKVIASPGSRSTSIGCHKCEGGFYHPMHMKETLICSFENARPPVAIQWVQKKLQEHSLITVTQEVIVTNNTNGTYDTSAVLHLVAHNYRQIAIFVCRATYHPTEWKMEKEILLDFSQREYFPSTPNSRYYFETRRKAEIRCGEPDDTIRIWKLIRRTGEPQTIGLRFRNSTEITQEITGIEISLEGNLIFSTPQIQHEGDYVCVYSNGVKDGVQKTAVVILVPPSPPYIRIEGCDDSEYICTKNEEEDQNITCTVDRIYPIATLEWVSRDPSQLSLYNYRSMNKKYGEVYDISATVKLVFSEELVCGEEIYTECRLQGPISRIIKADRIVQVIPKNCVSKRFNSGKWKIWNCLLTVGIFICFLFLMIYGFRTCRRRDFNFLEMVGIRGAPRSTYCWGTI